MIPARPTPQGPLLPKSRVPPALAYGLAAVTGARMGEVNARRLLGLAWAAHALALLGLLAGPVRFGFAPAMSVTAWLVGVLALRRMTGVFLAVLTVALALPS